MRPVAFALIFVSAMSLSASVRAEHRVALLIGNHAYAGDRLQAPARKLDALARSLSQSGFRCRILRNLKATEIKREIAEFTETTPTRGSSLIYFAGCIATDAKKKTVGLLGVDSKQRRGGFSLGDALERASSKGGSDSNVVVLDDPKLKRLAVTLPRGCAVAVTGLPALLTQLSSDNDLVASLRESASSWHSTLAAGTTLSGLSSRSISAPSKFVEGRRAGDEWVNSRGMVFCWCPPGRFQMGSPTQESGRFADEARRDVIISEGFWISKYEITIGQWRGNARGALGGHKNHPMNHMSQSKDTRDRELRPLTKRERNAKRLPEEWEYHLPTEEQWEYAARAGSSSTWSFGEELSLLPKHGNFGDKSYFDTGDVFSNAAHRTLDDGFAKLAPVGSFRPNAWGLHDVHGNVAEWCDNAVVRGGSWVSTAKSCRSAHRLKLGDRDKRQFVGVRVVIRRVKK